jgi:hypothetical protein
MRPLQNLPAEYGREILRTQVGSGVHGVLIEGTDDRDEMGICIEPPRFVIGLDKVKVTDSKETLHDFEQWTFRTQPEGARSGPGDLDLTVYTLRKWARLALGGNPTVLMPLFAQGQDVLLNTHLGMTIRDNPERFLSRQTADRFIGYMNSQRAQMLGLRVTQHTNRPELIAVYGFDTKFAYHMVRLGLQGVELLTTGRITLPIREPDRTWLTELRLGKHLKEEALARALDLEHRLVTLRETSQLPSHPNYAWANAWLVDTYIEEWARARR